MARTVQRQSSTLEQVQDPAQIALAPPASRGEPSPRRAANQSRHPRTLRVALLGLGVVGSAVYEILQQNAGVLAIRAGGAIAISRILVRNLDKPRRVEVARRQLTTDANAILADAEIDAVIEVMGGLHPAREYVLAALQSGKSVVCANKELMAECGQELLAVAAAHGVDLYFEASVGGGIPILRPLLDTLSAGRLHQVLGIVNGTTNYILSQMTETGKPFDLCLAEAQAAGYAESDPTADVAGHDAARKLALLASIAFRTHVRATDVATEGICKISPEDIRYAGRRQGVVKLLAAAEQRDGEIEAWVQPCFLPRAHPLAGVNDAYNAIYVRGREVGETMFYGRGAGGLPTASAIIGDLLLAAQHRHLGVSRSWPWFQADVPVRSATAESGCFYVRFDLMGEPNADEPAASGTLVGRLTGAGLPVSRWETLAASTIALETGPVSKAELEAALAAVSDIASARSCLRIMQTLDR